MRLSFKKFVGKVVMLEFDDHAVGMNTSVRCRAFGLVRSAEKGRILLIHWQILNDDLELKETNQEVTVIVSSCITSIKELVPA